MKRRDELLAKNARIRSTAEISDAEVQAAADNHRPRSGQGAFSLRQKLEDRVKELENLVGSASSSDIPLSQISANPWQPRRVFGSDEIQKLATSIAEIGLVQPIIVRSVSIRDTFNQGGGSGNESVSNRDTLYQIVAGERRYRAHVLLGKEFIKALVLDVDDADMATLALAENMDRADLTAYEIAVAIRNAEANFPNRKNLAEALGLNRTALYKYFSFFKLPDFIRADLDANPALLGRDAADSITALLVREGDRAQAVLQTVWPRVKADELDQGKIVGTIEAALVRREHVKTGRDIKKLFIGKSQAGSITRDSSSLTIKIRAAALTAEKEADLRATVERLFS